MAPTPSPRPISTHQTPSKTPQSKHRLNFPNPKITTPLPSVPTEHPVEVISRIRNFPDSKPPSASALEVSGDARSIRVQCDIGYRDFSLDGVSLSDAEGLEEFYQKYVGSRIQGVKLGAKCTIMMYGPTGSGKSHTMFGCTKQPGIVYRALRDILGEGEGESSGNGDDGGFGIGISVQVAVLEIYNEEIYDLLSGSLNPGGAGIGILKGNQTPKVRLEVMGKKAKNATYISGNEAGKISREVAKVEKRRIVKSTNCNERSSRSHCLIILDVPSVGGRLMLVDMAGSENIEQAGLTGFEAKMQTAKINQGNIALKRVVESIANGDSHVPFRDSKLTMLLQDSFEDDKSKILMILCASPDPKELHKTISTLEYGAKAKCIVRAAHMPPPKEKAAPDESSTLLRSRIAAMNQFIYKLQMENKLRERERDHARKELAKKEEELIAANSRLEVMERTVSSLNEEEIKSQVQARTLTLRLEIERMEEQVLRQQEELSTLRQRLEEMELERGKANAEALPDINGGRLAKRLSEISMGDQGMEKSMELDMGDLPALHDVKEIKEDNDEGEERRSVGDCEVYKEVVEERRDEVIGIENSNDERKTRIQNIFRLCGNYRELAQQVKVRTPAKISGKTHSSSSLGLNDENKPAELESFERASSSETPQDSKEGCRADGHVADGTTEACVKWEASKESTGNIIKKLKVSKDCTLSDLRKLIEAHLEGENAKQSFVFLLLRDPLGAPVSKEKEATVTVCKLPVCNNQPSTHLACLRPIKKPSHRPPFGSLENTIPLTGRV